MRALFLIISILLFSVSHSQNEIQKEQPFIEVIGTAQQEVIPDKIYIEIILSEKVVNRKSYTVVEQENNLKAKLNALNISLDQLALSDSNSEILRRRRRQTGVKITKEYVLLVNTSEEVSNVFRALKNININEASILKTENSKITDIRREVRIAAIKAAKEKAAYLLEAIDEELGQPMEVREYNVSNGNRSNSSIMAQSNIARFQNTSDSFFENDIAFETFTVKFSYYIKYAIK
ncbi:SIMPL domain-containing protein [uncultured Psychroserpens sp.]|uniref:SIMPL domain-containing protein n=1 Tax=uncultured Psychroserpens sp. TaxID=255436 RepID=UPI0026141164|nr:SIMPL domain-containing protein [uncultured Psychroserpens sp.]